MKTIILSFIALTGLAVNIGAHRPDAAGDFSKLRQFVVNIAGYDNNYTQEKVYLHLDNNGYLPDEEIWFKAYVFKASTLRPTNLSKVLYVELLTPNGQILERKTLPITNGRTYGNFKPDPALMRSGYYEVRAYTRAMLNWDDAYIFSRVVPVFQAPKDTIHYRDLTVEPHVYETKTLGYNRTAPVPLTDTCSQKRKSAILAFYPEGGYITEGQKANVAYRLTDGDGLPLNAAIEVYASDGQKVAESQVLHDGMGVFSLPATWQGGYAVVAKNDDKQIKFDLPQARKRGCDISIDALQADSIAVNISSSADMAGRLVGLSGTCRGALCYFDTIRLSGSNRVAVSRDKLRGGILQFTAFTPEGEILSERLTWNAPQAAPPTMTIKQNADTYNPFSPIVLDIDLKDAEGHPLQSDFSLSVRDADTEVAPDSHGLLVDMLLASDLKGYIHNPEYYFASDDEAHTRALDLLLMVQGWRRYSWQEMAGVAPFELKQPVEEGLLFLGKLKDLEKKNDKGKAIEPLNVNFLMTTDKGMKTFSAKSEADGSIMLMLPEFYGDAGTVITTTNSKDKRTEADIIVNRDFYPSRRPYEPAEIMRRQPIEDVRIKAVAEPSETFVWQDTIPDYISQITELQGAKVTARRERGYYPGARFAWLGGKNAFKSTATYYYDLVDELDRYKDSDNSVPNVFEWLEKVNPNFVCDYAPNTTEFPREHTYRGRPATIMVDNDDEYDKTNLGDETYLMNDYTAMAIVENAAVVKNTLGKNLETGVTVITLYTRDDIKQAPYYSAGTRWINMHGYSRCDDFFSPDYRTTEMPDLSDHRRTLYWAPDLMTDAHGKASVIFYSNANDNQRLHINAQGIAINGQLFSK